jgi:hypothetical protein
MADNMDYWWEKTLVAVEALATEFAPLGERLRDAWIS